VNGQQIKILKGGHCSAFGDTIKQAGSSGIPSYLYWRCLVQTSAGTPFEDLHDIHQSLQAYFHIMSN
jgi:hypothetical protein